MRWIRNFVACLILMWVIGACLKQPELSIIPQISIQSVSFVRGVPSAAYPIPYDTLIIKLNFADGDGDLGINQDETAIYAGNGDSTDIQSTYYYLYDSTQPSSWFYTHNNYLTSADLSKYKYVDFGSIRKYKNIQAFDTLPALSCNSWEIRDATVTAPIVTKDTLYLQNNLKSFDFFSNIYTASNQNGSFTYYNPNIYNGFSSDCQGNFGNYRFPVLSSNLGNNSPIQGTLTYKLKSPALYQSFKSVNGNYIQVSVYITDRAFHKSNVVTSNPIMIF